MISPLFSNRSRRAVYAAQWVVVLALVGVSFYTMIHPDPSATESRERRQRASSAIIYAEAEEHIETFSFDPNTADSTTLLRLGLAPWQVRAVYRYRAKHGRYNSPEDFQQLPGMTGELWERLSPCIRIAEKYRLLEVKPRTTSLRVVRDEAPVFPAAEPTATVVPSASAALVERDTVLRPIKFAPGTLVDLNTADTTTLKKIPKIASHRASKIVEYRRKLGGFLRTEQVMEACELPDEVLEWFTVNPQPVRKVKVNEWSVEVMMNHPYITFYMARDMVEWRKKHGAIPDSSVLLTLPHFTKEKVEQVLPYIEF
ncbi:MAG: helix-hairpin-helix domain-containing protein [Bacteroidaceae bacterium]|nr:helix-hairpin-helix domain-containing protein [Bacteroidaceae bacterium]